MEVTLHDKNASKEGLSFEFNPSAVVTACATHWRTLVSTSELPDTRLLAFHRAAVFAVCEFLSRLKGFLRDRSSVILKRNITSYVDVTSTEKGVEKEEADRFLKLLLATLKIAKIPQIDPLHATDCHVGYLQPEVQRETIFELMPSLKCARAQEDHGKESSAPGAHSAKLQGGGGAAGKRGRQATEAAKITAPHATETAAASESKKAKKK